MNTVRSCRGLPRGVAMLQCEAMLQQAWLPGEALQHPWWEEPPDTEVRVVRRLFPSLSLVLFHRW